MDKVKPNHPVIKGLIAQRDHLINQYVSMGSCVNKIESTDPKKYKEAIYALNTHQAEIDGQIEDLYQVICAATGIDIDDPEL